ncbi:hypothetical protein EWM64_g5030 [Hericium alpestre]|uniref:Uncharacterized protein n=1 Tax=Hericium alpestre TaxID=135208 RepID=A0A4Y9ZXS2_9AGAM|nr:hypothetical protein EWM64_g5030 [Hericium alpestre]
MSDLYHLRCPVRRILTEWLDTRPPILNTFDGVPSIEHDEDYIFSNDRNEIDPHEEDTVKPTVIPMFPPGLGIPPLDFDPKKLKSGRRLDDQSMGNAVFEVTWDGRPFVLKVNRQTEKDQKSRKDRHLAELNAYKRLLRSGLCDAGVVPQPYGYFHIWGQQHELTHPAEYPRPILLESIPNVTRLPRDQFTHENLFDLFERLPNSML